jgi:hypothetical protein
MVCRLRPVVYSLGLYNPPRNSITPRKANIKNLWLNKQGNYRISYTFYTVGFYMVQNLYGHFLYGRFL